MIKDQIGWQEVLLPINHNYINLDILGFLKSKHKKFREFFATGIEKKPFKRAHDGVTIQFYHLGMMCTVLLHCPISVEIRTVDSQSDL